MEGVGVNVLHAVLSHGQLHSVLGGDEVHLWPVNTEASVYHAKYILPNGANSL